MTLAATQTEVTDRSFAACFEVHHGEALRLAYLLTGDQHRAEDLVSEAFAKVYPKWRNGRIDDPRAYLRRAVVNQANGWFRRLRIERRELERQANAPATPGACAEDRLDDRDALKRALAVLPTRMRTAVVLRYFEDLSEAETAAVLGCSVGTVKSQVSRGLEHLRAALEAGEER